MRNASPKFKAVSGTDNSLDSEAGPTPSKLATSLTLAAMSLGYGVVQLDVTIVNTALNAIGTSRRARWGTGSVRSGSSSRALPCLRRPPSPAHWRPMQRR